MKRLIVLLSIVVLLATGCSVTKLDNSNISKNIKILLSEKVKLHNVHFEGYSYYVPKGLKFINKEEYNALLADFRGNKYYLYVDAISYYHKVENTYKEDKDAHFSKRLDYNKKNGYIQINEIEDKYFVQFVYNYSKIEAFVNKNDLTDAINNMCYILRTIKFNDTILESLIGENILSYKEENFSLFKAETSKDSFLDVVSKYEDDAYKEDLEDEKIDLDEDE